ncbi:hypothetical protein LTR94_017469 [Friedmanniomyces endolithicus]|nr:hypothetical protein LTR94_017469 [Friedmanniomyces endolithicus]
MAAVLALMETPAILTALVLMHGAGREPSTGRGVVLREVLVGAATVMLLGSFLVGLISGEAGLKKLDLLMADRRKLTWPVIGFALGFPVLSAGVALALGRLAGLGLGDAAMLAVLAGSASYIAVPAAMRVAAPKADPGVFVTTSLAVTFPFNLVIGIALYTAAAVWLWA